MPKRSEEYMIRRRQEILEAAHHIFQKKGFHRTSIDDICAAANLSVGALYTHFKNKREIMLAMTSQVGQDYLNGPFKSVESFKAAVTTKIKQASLAHRDVEMELQLIAESISDPKIRLFIEGALKRREKYFADTLTSLQEGGLIASDYDVDSGARRLNTIMLGAFYRNYFLGEADGQDSQTVVDMEFALMLPRTAG